LLAVVVHAANIQERDGAKRVFIERVNSLVSNLFGLTVVTLGNGLIGYSNSVNGYWKSLTVLIKRALG
jgi:hypothetical protein